MSLRFTSEDFLSIVTELFLPLNALEKLSAFGLSGLAKFSR
jgi:hypothetical protein